jgi:DNA-damage-inducible protein J
MTQKTQSALLQVRLDESVKRKADTLFADLGFDTPTAVRIFLAKAIEWEGMPFEVAKPRPNAETLKAMLDGMEIIPKRYGSFDEILAEVHDEIEAEGSDEL